MKCKKFIILVVLLFLLILIMTVGYAVFTTQLNINGTAEIMGEWNVKITNIEATDVSEGCDPGDPQYTDTSVTLDAKLNKPGDSITYVITIKNAGTIDATLGSVIFKEEDDGSEVIKFTTTEISHTLEAGEETTLNVKVEYDSKVTEAPSVKTKTLTGIIEYVQN